MLISDPKFVIGESDWYFDRVKRVAVLTDTPICLLFMSLIHYYYHFQKLIMLTLEIIIPVAHMLQENRNCAEVLNDERLVSNYIEDVLSVATARASQNPG